LWEARSIRSPSSDKRTHFKSGVDNTVPGTPRHLGVLSEPGWPIDVGTGRADDRVVAMGARAKWCWWQEKRRDSRTVLRIVRTPFGSGAAALQHSRNSLSARTSFIGAASSFSKHLEVGGRTAVHASWCTDTQIELTTEFEHRQTFSPGPLSHYQPSNPPSLHPSNIPPSHHIPQHPHHKHQQAARK